MSSTHPDRLRVRGAALACLCLSIAVTSAQTPAPPQPAPPGAAPGASVQQLAWLAGSWASDAADPVAQEEHWTSPRGGAMLGMNRTVKGDRMVAFEFVRIEERDGTLVYLASPGGRPPTTFTLAELADGRVVFENPTHDFPQRVLYTRHGDRLTARIEGTRDGRARSMEWTWTRTPLAR